MGNQTIVHGYIESNPCDDDYNKIVLEKYEYDETYPFTNIFSYPRKGYYSSVISFAGSYKSLDQEWDEWQVKFENLLGKLKCDFSEVYLDDEVDGLLRKYSYIRQTNELSESGKQVWCRIRENDKGEEIEKVYFSDLSCSMRL